MSAPDDLLLDTSFPTLLAAVGAIQCGVAAAVAQGHEPAQLCARLSTNTKSTSVMLGTRRLMAHAARDAGTIEASVVDSIATHAPGEALILIDVDGGKTYGVGASRMLDVVALIRNRSPVA